MHYQNYKSPLGCILLVGHNGQLHSLTLPTQRPADWPLPQWTHSKTGYNDCVRQLDEYFEGKRYNRQGKVLLYSRWLVVPPC